MDWKNIISTVAPMLGTALGGPLAGLAVDAIGNALGLSDKTENAIKAAISGATPEQMIAIKQADQEFTLQMRKLGFENEQALSKIAADDRNSAREREMKTGDSTTPRIFAALIIIGWISLQWFMLGHVIDQSMREIVSRLLGTFDGALMLVLSYYFGSSASSSEKNQIIANAPRHQ